MKAQHRHELKTNELAEWLSNLPNWAKENLRMIIYVSAIVVVVIGFYGWKAYKENIVEVKERMALSQLIAKLTQDKLNTIKGIKSEDIDYSYLLLDTAKRLQNFARNTKKKDMAALAYIKQAEALRAELHYRMGLVNKSNLTEQINQAKKAYENAIELARDNPVQMANARFGLGLCQEELGNFNEAKKIYEQVTKNSDFAETVAAASAGYRLKIMDDYKNIVKFKAAKQKPVKRPVLTPKQVPPDINFSEPVPSSTVENLPPVE